MLSYQTATAQSTAPQKPFGGFNTGISVTQFCSFGRRIAVYRGGFKGR
ncbi:MAG: hypothetical protein R3D88_00555 [Alphaproteobacteria bacterium]